METTHVQFELGRIIDELPGLVWTATPDGSIDFVSRRWCEYIGVSGEEACNDGWETIVHPDDLPELLESWDSIRASGSNGEMEARLRRSDGEYRWFLIRVSRMTDLAGYVLKWFGLGIDIDDRKRNEENFYSAETNFNQIVESIPVPVAVTYPDGEVDALNRATLEYFGKTLEELKGWKSSDVVHPDDLERTVADQVNAHIAGDSYNVESRHRRADGTYRWFNVIGLPLRDSQGSILRWFHLQIDIDDRKRAEQELRASERDLNEVINTIPALAWSARTDGTAEFFNKHYLDFIGLSLDEAAGWGWAQAVHPDDRDALSVAWQRIMGSEDVGEAEARLRRHDGEYRWFLFRANPMRDKSGSIVKWFGINTDIEDRKRAQEALAANERYLRSIIDTIPSSIYVLDTEGFVQLVNQAVIDYTGLTLEDAQQEDYRDRVIHPEDFKRVRAERSASLRRGAPFSTEQRVLGVDGHYRWFLVRYKPLLNEDGRIIRWYVAAFDIEDRKRAEAEVEQAYVRLAEAQRLSKTGSFITDLLADEHNWSDEAYRIFEFDPGTKITTQKIRDKIHPEDLSLVDSAARRAMSGSDVDFGYRIVTANGEVKHIHFVAHAVERVEGRPVFVGALRDVTESKVAEDALRESERQFKTIFDEAGAGITLVDLKKGEPIRNNRALQKMLACSEEELSRFETYDKLTHEANRKNDSKTFRELTDGKCDSLRMEKHFVLKDGRSIWANVIFNLLRDEDGQPRYIIAIHEDITERKQNEETFRTIVETNPECVKVITSDGTLQRVNAAGVAMAGVPSEESILGLCFYDFVVPEDRDRYREFNESICSGNKGGLEFDIITAKGELRHMETHAAPMLSADGSIAQLGVSRDITERKRTLEKLQANQDLLELAQKAAGAMAFDWHIQDEANEWSAQQEALYGLVPGGFDGTYQGWKALIDERDWPNVVEAIQHAQETGQVRAEFRVVWPDGSIHWLATNGRMFFDSQGKPLRMVGFTSDVTHQKTIEHELRRSEAFLAEGQRLSQLGSFSWLVAEDELKWSEQLYRIFEFEPGTPMTFELFGSRFHPEDLWMLYDSVEKGQSGADDFEYEYRIVMPDQSLKYLHVIAHRTQDDCGRLEYMGAVQDVTQRRLTEEGLSKARSELAMAARSMSLGVLTASIAHEVSQPLSGIITNASTCVRMLDADPPNVDGARETAKRTIRDGNRASDVITRLRALFGKKESTVESIDLNEAAQEVIALSWSELQRSQVVLQTRLAKNLPRVEADRVQLQQVILNLLLNGAEAMGDVDGRQRQLTIQTEFDGNEIRLSVRDVGKGFTTDEAEKLFDAFFTTKKTGMGIGLSVSHSIIERHNGKFWASPNDGPGSVFSFTIPVQNSSRKINANTDTYKQV